MSDKVSRETKLNALIMKDKGVIVRQVSAALAISESTIYRAQVSRRMYGDVEAEKQKPGPHPFIPPGIGKVFYPFTFHQLI
jgi:hypothetical protein